MLANTIAKRIDTEIKLMCYVKDGRKGKSENIRREREEEGGRVGEGSGWGN